MPSEDKMRSSVQAYSELFNACDYEAIADLFSDDAVIIDPVGTEPKIGKKNIVEFYKMATRGGTHLENPGPVRIAANTAAFPLKALIKGIKAENKAVDVDLPSGAMTIDIIDVFTFDEDGKITNMQAYWGPSNITKT